MMPTTLTLSFHSFRGDDCAEAVAYHPYQEVEDRLVAKGYTRLLLTGLPREDFRGGVGGVLGQMLLAYYQLERLVASCKSFTHSAFLSDGALVIVATVSNAVALVEVRSAPMLNAALAYTNSVSVPFDGYVQAWRLIATDILRISSE